MREGIEQLAESLLYEGYALFPYTPGATKNATPTPFGIVYTRADAEGNASTFDHLQVECVAIAPADAEVSVSVLCLEAEGERHQGAARRVDCPPERLDLLAAADVATEFAFDTVSGRVQVAATAAGSLVRVTIRVENTTEVAEAVDGFDRAVALRRALLSTHVMLAISKGRFASPLERDGEIGEAVSACENVNTWPVLAAPEDDEVLAASILLPDHPAINPESRGNLFDNTEIEEALLLHVHTLSEGEREEIGAQDPAVREMIERAAATTPDEMISLHGLMKPSQALGGSGPQTLTEPGRPAPPDTEVRGEEEAVVDGKHFRRGGKVLLRPGKGGDPYDTMLDGRTATIERIYLDYEGKTYVGVSVDDDPMQEILSDSGRFLFFFSDELEVTP